MAPVVSRIPPETWLEVMNSLTFPDRRSLMLTSWTLHDIVAPIVYRALTMRGYIISRRPGGHRIGSQRFEAHRFLSCIVLSIRHYNGLQHNSPYASLLKSFSLLSYVTVNNLRILPMFVMVLKFMTSLESLRIEVNEDSLPLLIALLQRGTTLRQQHSVHSAMWNFSGSSSTMFLPRLRSIRSNRYSIMAYFASLRSLRSFVLDHPLYPSTLRTLIRDAASIRVTQLSIISLTLTEDLGESIDVLRGVFTMFPMVEELAVRTSSLVAVGVAIVSGFLLRSLLLRSG